MAKKSSTSRSRLRSAAASGVAAPVAAHAPPALFWVKVVIGLALLPICYITTQTFLGAFGSTSAARGIITSAPLWFFAVGSALWLIAFFGLPRPLYLYVLGHELTHALFVVLCGGKISSLKVRREGGHIITDKNNILISLSPYFVPFYSIVVIAAFGLLGLFIDLSAYHPNSLFWGHIGFSPSWLLYMSIGATWCFHLTFTAWMILKSQPDLQQNGTFFSLTVIYLVNLLVLCAMLIIVSRSVHLVDFGSAWLSNFNGLLTRF